MLDDDHPVEDAAEAQVAGSQVVVVYRRQGVPWLLLPPLLLIAAVVGIIGYRKTARPERPIVIVQAAPDEAPPKDFASETGAAPTATSPTADEAKAPAVVLPEQAPVATPQPPAVPPDAVTVLPPPVTAPAQGPAPAPAPEAKEGPAGSPFDVVAPRPAAPPMEPPTEPPTPPAESVKRDVVGFDPDAAKVTVAPDPADGPALGEGRPGEGPMKPKTDDILSELQREAEARQAERLRLEAAKPDLLKGDPRETRARISAMITEARREAERQRMPFHADLRLILAAKGNQGGRDIQDLFDSYGGRDCLPEIARAVNSDLVGPAARLSPQARVDRMRRWGQPEQLILEDLVEREKLNANGRGGPRTLDQVWVVAARVLLTMPPKDRRPATPGARTVGSTPPGPQ